MADSAALPELDGLLDAVDDVLIVWAHSQKAKTAEKV